MKRRPLALTTMFLLLLPAAWTRPTGVDPNNNRAQILRTELPRSMFSCIDCTSCANGHVTRGEDPEGFFGGGLHDDACLSGSCLLVHGICGGQTETPDFDPDAAVEQARILQEALIKEDRDVLRGFLSGSDAVVVLVRTRSSFQILGCHGTPIANFPIDGQMVALLAR